MRVCYDRRAVAHTMRVRRTVLQLDVVCHNHVRQHGFQLVGSKEPSGAVHPSVKINSP